MAKSAYPRALGSLALAAALAGCHGQTSAPAAAPVPVSVEKVVRQDVPVMADYVAHTEAVQQVDLVPRVDGYLQTVNFRDGSFVHQGQLLMQIQPEQYQAAVLAAQASLDKGNANLVRAESNVADQTAKAQVAADAAVYFRAVKQSCRSSSRLPRRRRFRRRTSTTRRPNSRRRPLRSTVRRPSSRTWRLNQRTAILNAKSDIDQATAQLDQRQAQPELHDHHVSRYGNHQFPESRSRKLRESSQDADACDGLDGKSDEGRLSAEARAIISRWLRDFSKCATRRGVRR